jgi:flagellar basal-body rod protein FlgC
MSSFNVFDIAGSGMSAESVRLNTVASNLANADSVSGDPTQVYQAKHPVFQTVQALGAAASHTAEQASAGVKVARHRRQPGRARGALRPRQSARQLRRLCL